jgi:hypothetical protein
MLDAGAGDESLPHLLFQYGNVHDWPASENAYGNTAWHRTRGKTKAPEVSRNDRGLKGHDCQPECVWSLKVMQAFRLTGLKREKGLKGSLHRSKPAPNPGSSGAWAEKHPLPLPQNAPWSLFNPALEPWDATPLPLGL